MVSGELRRENFYSWQTTYLYIQCFSKLAMPDAHTSTGRRLDFGSDPNVRNWCDVTCSSDSKVSAYNVGDLGLIPGSGRSPGEGNSNPLQYSCWKIPRTKDPGGLQSMGLQRVRHDWATSLHFTSLHLRPRNVPGHVLALCDLWAWFLQSGGARRKEGGNHGEDSICFCSSETYPLS